MTAKQYNSVTFLSKAKALKILFSELRQAGIRLPALRRSFKQRFHFPEALEAFAAMLGNAALRLFKRLLTVELCL